MNVFKHELWANLKTTFLWFLLPLLLVGGGIGKAAVVLSSGQDIMPMIEQLPRLVRVISNMGYYDLSTVEGWYGVIFGHLVTAGATYAVMLSAGIIAKEEREKTAEFLLTRPISRHQLLIQKLIVVILNMIIFCIGSFGLSLAVLSDFSLDSRTITHIMVMICGMFVIQMLFVGIGAFVAAVTPDARQAVGRAVLVLLATFCVLLVDGLLEDPGVLHLFSPLSYVRAIDVINGAGLDWFYMSWSLIWAALLIGLALRRYERRDMAL